MTERIHTFVYDQPLEEVADFLIEWAAREDSQYRTMLRRLRSPDSPFIHPTTRVAELGPGVLLISFYDGRLPIELVEPETEIVLYPGEMKWADPVIRVQLTRVQGNKTMIIFDCLTEEFVSHFQALLAGYGEAVHPEYAEPNQFLEPTQMINALPGQRGDDEWWKSQTNAALSTFEAVKETTAPQVQQDGETTHNPGEKMPEGDGLLTPRQIEVADLVAEGKSDQEIAEALVISTLTVKTHRRDIGGKWGKNSGSDSLQKAAKERGYGKKDRVPQSILKDTL